MAYGCLTIVHLAGLSVAGRVAPGSIAQGENTRTGRNFQANHPSVVVDRLDGGPQSLQSPERRLRQADFGIMPGPASKPDLASSVTTSVRAPPRGVPYRVGRGAL